MKALTRECRPENLIATVRGSLAAMEVCGRVPSGWRVGIDFWAAFESNATVLRIERVAVEDIERVFNSLPQPTMGGIPVLIDPNMERNKAALVTKDGDVVTIIELGHIQVSED